MSWWPMALLGGALVVVLAHLAWEIHAARYEWRREDEEWQRTLREALNNGRPDLYVVHDDEESA